jgi:hypothetical protein
MSSLLLHQISQNGTSRRRSISLLRISAIGFWKLASTAETSNHVTVTSLTAIKHIKWILQFWAQLLGGHNVGFMMSEVVTGWRVRRLLWIRWGGKGHDTAHKVRQFFISGTNGSLHMRMQSSSCSRRYKAFRSFWREHVLLTRSADKDSGKVIDEINPQEYMGISNSASMQSPRMN